MHPTQEPNAPAEAGGRRSFFASLAMLAALAASYGSFAAIAVRFLFPARRDPRAWLFVAEAGRIGPGGALRWVTPAGLPVLIARKSDTGSVDDFIALSSTCPHLGCQVHWEPDRSRFFCPCHNGTFDPDGRATGGPPFKAGQSLGRYPLQLERGLLFLEAPIAPAVAAASGCSGCPRRAGRECA